MPEPKNILVVENHPDVARVFAFMLETRGYSPTVVASVAEAKATLSAKPFDVLVCDYRLDDGEGIDLIDWIQTEQMPLISICVSGFGEEAAERCLKAGFHGFLSKPVDLDALESTIASLQKRGGDGHDGHAAPRR